MTSTDESNFFKTAELSRLMVPADANVAGNVHGGTIMQMIEESACVAASRFYNHYSDEEVVKVVTARVESITFQKPLHVGDVAKVQAQVVFASNHTVAVAVKVMAERLTSKEDVVGNRALLWIVGHVHKESSSTDMAKDHNGIATVQRKGKMDLPLAKAPKLEAPTDKEGLMAYKLAKMAYEKRKARQESDPASLPDSDVDENTNPAQSNSEEDDAFSPDQSEVTLAQCMLPADCVTGAGLVRGGVVMKLMDNASGVAAVRHCGTNIVTVSVDAVDLVKPVMLGDVLKIHAVPIFTSAKSIEIQVSVTAERFCMTPEGKLERRETVSTKQAYFTFVSLGPTGRTLPMRPLAPQTDAEKKIFIEGKQRYEQRKALRAGAAMKQQKK
ncbi:Cytosolic acyl coenzyme A thioester hydrolase [Seminavis robusta]|uniref:Cytosolic acyl coenzyme A thioester hydrolase n=1 Tax=Seminavis robusta TaxID=568900 RepID=A0A9N8DVA6_9STRA|nr:Cytosolic acyl coenzyme A thioester hydrolase [Seminavis robusta]|eukprot:Sro319_g116340.1 Cytosolic acyl coenzyme A thioester hydrolase (385) ;mRNA; r:60692-61846